MTKTLNDLVKTFSDCTYDEQLERIRRARSARTLERPVAAVKRVKKEAKKKDKHKTATVTAMLKLSPEQKAALIAKLKKDLGQ